MISLSQHINYHKSKILLAISGGIDSMVLLHLCGIQKLYISVAHCNFQLRNEESDQDEIFVKEYCLQHKIPFFSQKFKTQEIASSTKEPIQVAARNLRYNWFNELIEQHHFDYLFTAHHLDDQVETFLINFTRGTGINGLLGIPEQNGKIFRPLLHISREEIESYAKEHHLHWREDSSNNSNKYLRNQLRHDVIPILKELNASFLNSFEKTIASLKQTNNFLNEIFKKLEKEMVAEHEDEIRIDLQKLLAFKNYKEFLFYYLSKYDFSAWEDIYQLVTAQSGKIIYSSNYQLLKDRNELILKSINSIENQRYSVNTIENDTNFPLKFTFWEEKNNFISNKNTIFVDANKIKFPLTIRKWKEGDSFFPINMKGKKKLSKFFKDEKINLFEKQAIWILESNQEIVWIIDYRADDRFKITENTEKILKIEYKKTKTT